MPGAPRHTGSHGPKAVSAANPLPASLPAGRVKSLGFSRGRGVSICMLPLRFVSALLAGGLLQAIPSNAGAQYLAPLKASNAETEERFQQQADQLREALGPVPYPPGYKVAFADKEPQRSRSLRTQTPVTGREAIALVKENPELQIIDLRMPVEFEDEHLPGAINVPFVQPHSGFVRDLAKLDPDRPTLIYCDIGEDTSKARLGFGVFGFDQLYPLRDGLRGWIAAGGPTEGPKQGPAYPLDEIPAIEPRDLPPTPPADAAAAVSDGPFPVLPVSNDFALASDFAFDGRGGITSAILTFLIRKDAAVVGKPFRTIPDVRYPREHLKDWTGIRLFHGDIGGRDQIRFRADGSLLRPFFPARGNPSRLRVLRHEVVEKRGLPEDVIRLEEEWVGKGIYGIQTDHANNIWCSTIERWTRDPATKETRPPSLGLISPDNRFLTLYEGAPLEMPYGLVHDARRSLLFFSEPLKKEIWVLPVDAEGQVGGEPRRIASLPDSEPWGLALDEFGNLYAAAEPNVLRFRTDASGAVVGEPVVLNAEPIERAHAIHFGHGTGFDERSLYVLSTPATWRLVADPLTGYVLGSFREDGSVSRQLENVRALMSPLVRLDLGVRGAPETLVTVATRAPDQAPEEKGETPDAHQAKPAF